MKKATKANVVKEEPVLDISKLDFMQLTKLVEQARERLIVVGEETKDDRIKAFKKTPYFKGFKALFDPIKEKMQSVPTKATFAAGVTFTVTVEPYNGPLWKNKHSNLFNYEVKAGKVEGKGLTKLQREELEQRVEGYVCNMCEDGLEIFFPDLLKQMKAIEEEFDAIFDQFDEEVKKFGLSYYDIFS